MTSSVDSVATGVASWALVRWVQSCDDAEARSVAGSASSCLQRRLPSEQTVRPRASTCRSRAHKSGSCGGGCAPCTWRKGRIWGHAALHRALVGVARDRCTVAHTGWANWWSVIGKTEARSDHTILSSLKKSIVHSAQFDIRPGLGALPTDVATATMLMQWM